METEDPGILDPGTWEFIVASTATAIKDGPDVYEFPILDVSYGLTESVQISATYPYVWVDPPDGSSDSDFGNLSVALKWRFWNSERLQLAFAPVHSFGINVSRAVFGFGEDKDATFVPISMEATPWPSPQPNRVRRTPARAPSTSSPARVSSSCAGRSRSCS